MAAEDFTGPVDLLDSAERYDPGVLLSGLGARWHVTGTYFKPYSCCRWLHAPIDALLMLIVEHAVLPDEIEAIEVGTFARTLTLSNEVAPASLEGALYSLPFCLGLAAVGGAEALLPIQMAALANASVQAMSRRVSFYAAVEFNGMFPASVPGRVRLVTKRGAWEKTVLSPKGEPSNPMSSQDLEAKFQFVAKTQLTSRFAEGIMEGVRSLSDGSAALRASLCRDACGI